MKNDKREIMTRLLAASITAGIVYDQNLSNIENLANAIIGYTQENESDEIEPIRLDTGLKSRDGEPIYEGDMMYFDWDSEPIKVSIVRSEFLRLKDGGPVHHTRLSHTKREKEL